MRLLLLLLVALFTFASFATASDFEDALDVLDLNAKLERDAIFEIEKELLLDQLNEMTNFPLDYDDDDFLEEDVEDFDEEDAADYEDEFQIPFPFEENVNAGRKPKKGCSSVRRRKYCVRYDGCKWSSRKCSDNTTPGEVKHVLFLGNSFTFMNKMPTMFQSLANKAGYNVKATMVALPGRPWIWHAYQSAETRKALMSRKWDAVVLQEQSMFLSQPRFFYYNNSIRPAKELQKMIVAKNSAKTVLFETWGYRIGNEMNDDYFAMQGRLLTGYRDVRSALKEENPSHTTLIAPVGEAFSKVYSKMKNRLYQPDGRHPKPTASYLAALTIFSTIFDRTPKGIPFSPKGVTKSDKAALIQAAHNAWSAGV